MALIFYDNEIEVIGRLWSIYCNCQHVKKKIFITSKCLIHGRWLDDYIETVGLYHHRHLVWFRRPNCAMACLRIVFQTPLFPANIHKFLISNFWSLLIFHKSIDHQFLSLSILLFPPVYYPLFSLQLHSRSFFGYALPISVWLPYFQLYLEIHTFTIIFY